MKTAAALAVRAGCGNAPPLVVRFSGGRSSGMMLHQLLERGEFVVGRDLCVFTNTGEEDDATLDFVQECGERWGVDIAWLEYRLKNRAEALEAESALRALEGDEVGGERYRALWNCRAGPVVSPGFRHGGERDPLAPASEVRALQKRAQGRGGWARVCHQTAARRGEPFRDLILSGNCAIGGFATKRICTASLKLGPTDKYIASLGLDVDDTTRVLGFRWDEPRRVARAKERGDLFRAPLHEARVGREEVVSFWRKMPFDLRLPAVNGQSMHGNCSLCFLKGRKKIARLMAECPVRAARWIEMEKLMARRRNRWGCRMWLMRVGKDGSIPPNTGWSLRPGGRAEVDSDWLHDGRIYRPTFLQGTDYATILAAAESGAWKKWVGDDGTQQTLLSDINLPTPPCECGD